MKILILAQMNKNRVLVINDKLDIVSYLPLQQLLLPPFNPVITRMIENEEAYVASDTLVKE